MIVIKRNFIINRFIKTLFIILLLLHINGLNNICNSQNIVKGKYMSFTGMTFSELRQKNKPDTCHFSILKTEEPIKKRSNIFKKVYNYLLDSNKVPKNPKKFDFTIIGAPHYASDIQFAVVVAASALYSIKGNKPYSPKSTISLSGDFSTNGFIYAGLNGIMRFNDDKIRINHNIYYYSQKSDFWGVGYEMGRYAPKSVFKRTKGLCQIEIMYNFHDRYYIGPSLDFNYINGLYFSDISYINGEPKYNYNLGLGALLVYDSRDFAPNAQKGQFISIEQLVSPSIFSNSGLFQKTEFFYRYYHKIIEGTVIAAEAHLVSVYGDTPWSVLPYMGGSMRMRGYYEGRYRDRNIAELQIELRQKIYKRSGAVVWVGAGNVFDDYSDFKLSHTLPCVGIGYRWEFKNRINLRMDIGRGIDHTGIIFSIEEAF